MCTCYAKQMKTDNVIKNINVETKHNITVYLLKPYLILFCKSEIYKN